MAIGRPRKEEPEEAQEEKNEEYIWIKTELKNPILKEPVLNDPILIESKMIEPKLNEKVMY